MNELIVHEYLRVLGIHHTMNAPKGCVVIALRLPLKSQYVHNQLIGILN